jgi:hypothetical protein
MSVHLVAELAELCLDSAVNHLLRIFQTLETKCGSVGLVELHVRHNEKIGNLIGTELILLHDFKDAHESGIIVCIPSALSLAHSLARSLLLTYGLMSSSSLYPMWWTYKAQSVSY